MVAKIGFYPLCQIAITVQVVDQIKKVLCRFLVIPAISLQQTTGMLKQANLVSRVEQELKAGLIAKFANS